MPKAKVPETPKERLELAKRYLRNAKETLKKAGVDRVIGEYVDLKYVSEACGTAYLASLEALKALFMYKKRWDGDTLRKKVKDIGMYKNVLKDLAIGKDKDKLSRLLTHAYNILHLGGYYRELHDKKSIDSGFEKVEKIIKIVEKHINGKV